MGLKERVKAVREHFGLTQKEFGARLCVSRNTIAKYEYEGRRPEGPVLELLRREFGISKKWLLEGTGEMFTPTETGIVAEAVKQYQLDELDRAILKLYLSLDADGRAKLRRAAVELADALGKTPGLMELLRPHDTKPEEPEEPESREQEAAKIAGKVYREALSKGETASVSGTPPDGVGVA